VPPQQIFPVGWGGKLAAQLENIRFEQSLFALPFAYLGMVLAARGLPAPHQFLWITVAMVGARTFGMSMNRLVDLDLDREHRTARTRPLPSGRLSTREVIVIAVAGVVLTFIAAWQLNPLCLTLAPVAIGIFAAYSYIKRFSWLTHAALGVCLGGAPVGGWIAVTGEMAWEAVLLGLIVMTWATGFDILYACGDEAEDRRLGVKTFPVRFGVGPALAASAAVHCVTVGLLAWAGVIFALGWPFWAGTAAVAALLAYEHFLVRPDDLSRLNTAFFTVNGLVSLLVFGAAFASLYA
jgi:4-hydroxybenzoate polyprenyltransferase